MRYILVCIPQFFWILLHFYTLYFLCYCLFDQSFWEALAASDKKGLGGFCLESNDSAVVWKACLSDINKEVTLYTVIGFVIHSFVALPEMPARVWLWGEG